MVGFVIDYLLGTVGTVHVVSSSSSKQLLKSSARIQELEVLLAASARNS